jgi:hypothetical protein
MTAECNSVQLEFHTLGKREVTGKFDGGRITSDGGGILLREVEHRLGILKRLSDCFTDHRDPDLIEHDTVSLIKQRVYAIALGYEDLNDHDHLRQDSILALLCGKHDVTVTGYGSGTKTRRWPVRVR